VSEYQYYEFRALDRRLTAEQQQRLRSLSSRAEISATRLANEYSFGDFRGDPGRLQVQLGGVDFDEDEDDDADEAEPPVPAGLRELSDSLAAVAQFLKIDDDLIATAAKASGPLAPASDDRIADWVTARPASEKDKYLTMVAQGEGAQVEALLVGQFWRETRPAGVAETSAGRTASELLAGAKARRAAREQAEARAREEARARRAAEQAAAYERHLEKLAGRRDETWQQVEKLTVLSKPKEYDQATQLLRDLLLCDTGVPATCSSPESGHRPRSPSSGHSAATASTQPRSRTAISRASRSSSRST